MSAATPDRATTTAGTPRDRTPALDRPERRALGGGGPLVSRLALGTMTFGVEADERAAHEMLDTYVDRGGNLIDTADVYGAGASEEIIGRWLRRSGRRDDVVLTTKGRFPMPGVPGAGLSAAYLRRALDASLGRLGVDHVDLYLAHGPDLSTPMEDLAAFLAEAVGSGRAAHVGVSNLPAWQLAKLARILHQRGGPPLAAHQPQYNLLAREVEWELLPAARDAGVPAVVWGPLAAGWLTGKYERNAPPPPATRLGDDPGRGIEAWERRGTERTWTALDMVRLVSDDVGQPPAVVALAWVADRAGVASAIVGARDASQLRQSLRAAEVHLPPEAVDVLDLLTEPPVPDYPYRFAIDSAPLV